MIKSKIKKSILSFLTAIFLTTSVFVALPAQSAYAAGICPDGFIEIDGGKKCKADNQIIGACPEGLILTSPKDTLPIECGKKPVSEAALQDLKGKIALLTGVQKFLNKIIWPVLVLTGGLMDNSLLFGSGMEEQLRNIWIPIRNLVNILFVIILVGIALYNVLGIGDENSEYAVKSILPKIIIGIIAVNFSFLAIKVVLDGINVLTVSIFSLPGQVSEGLDEVLKFEEGKIAPGDKDRAKSLCASLSGKNVNEYESASDAIREKEIERQVYHSVLGKVTPAIKGLSSMSLDDMKKHTASTTNKASIEKQIKDTKEGKFCNAAGEVTPAGIEFLRRYNSRNAAFAMALNMGKIVFYEQVNWEGLQSIDNLLINTLASMLLYLVYVASFLALFVVLLGRMVVLWLSIAISPILVLLMGSGGLKDKFGEFGKIVDQFTKNAIAPVLIALSMSIGWIMLKAIQGTNALSSDSALKVDPTSGIPVVGLNTLQDFTVAVGTIAVVWLGVFSAAEGTIASAATNWMKERLTQAGKYLGTMPFKHTPFIPITVDGEEEQYTIGQLGTAVKRSFTDTEDTKLWEKISNEKPVTPKTLNSDRVTDPASAMSVLKRLKDNGDLTTNAGIQSLKDFKQNKSEIYNKLDTQIKDKIDELINAKDAKERETAAAELDTNLKNKGIQPMKAEKVSESDKKQAQKATPPEETVKKIMPEETIETKGSDNKVQRAQAEKVAKPGSDELKKMNSALSTLGDKLKDPTKINKNDITAILESPALKLNEGKNALTTEMIKAKLGEKNYGNLLTALDTDPAKAQKALEDHLKKNLQP